MPYIGKNPSNFRRSLTEKDTFTGDGSTTTFDTTSNIPGGSANDVQIYVGTTVQIPGTDYTIGLDGSNRLRRITFTSAPAGSSTITVLNPGITDTQQFQIALLHQLKLLTAQLLTQILTLRLQLLILN